MTCNTCEILLKVNPEQTLALAKSVLAVMSAMLAIYVYHYSKYIDNLGHCENKGFMV